MALSLSSSSCSNKSQIHIVTFSLITTFVLYIYIDMLYIVSYPGLLAAVESEDKI